MSSRLKVLMIMMGSPYDAQGGLGVHTRHLCNELRKHEDIELTFISADYITQQGGMYLIGDEEKKESVSLDDWKYTPNKYRLLEVFNTNDLFTQNGFIQKMITNDIFIENVLSLLGSEKFDLIHLHDSNLWKVAKNLRALYKCPILLSCHLNLLLSHERIPEDPHYMYDIQQEGTAIHESRKLICVSEYYKRKMIEYYHRDEDSIISIHNGVDFEFLNKIKYNKTLRSRYDKPLIVFVGRLVPTKGVWHILEAIKQLPEYHFVLISIISPTLESVSDIVDEIKLMKTKYSNFEWLNNLDQDKKWDLMKIADIGIMPSLHEPFGITALEWVGLGVPLIVSDTGGLKEFCTGQNSTLIESSSLNLINAVKNHKRDESRIENGIQTAKHFKWSRIANKTIQVYRGMIND